MDRIPFASTIRNATIICMAGLAMAATACGGYSTTDYVGGNANLTGTWKGNLTATEGTRSATFAVTLSLTQTGGNVSGTAVYSDNSGTNAITGTVDGSRIALHQVAPVSPSDDCDKFPVDFGGTVNGSTMLFTTVSGSDCQGDGHGGHSSITPITGISGSLTKQSNGTTSYLRSPAVVGR
jgi:hypothetical protein